MRGAEVVVADLQSDFAVIVTHPWGPLGGDLSNNVVAAAAVYFQNRRITTVRFNFTGSQIGRGTAQVDQLRQLAADMMDGSLLSTDPKGITAIKPSKLILCGYSYGSLISSSASASIPQVIATISIAPPFGVAHWLLVFNSGFHLQQAGQRTDIQRLLLLGDQDNFTSETSFRKTIRDYYPSDETTSIVVMRGVDHFFAGGKATECMELIGGWFSKIKNP